MNWKEKERKKKKFQFFSLSLFRRKIWSNLENPLVGFQIVKLDRPWNSTCQYNVTIARFNHQIFTQGFWQ